MREITQRSVRMAIDLQACQTPGSANRGVGRYSLALFNAICAQCDPIVPYALVSQHFPVPVSLDAIPYSHVVYVPPLPDWGTGRNYQSGEQDSLDEVALSTVLGQLNPDIVHVSHVFEGFSERVALPKIGAKAVGQIISATLYDLIPLRFKDYYFRDEGFRKWYLSRLGWLRQADLLLAISETSRQDAINLLGIDPNRIVTIHGGISDNFRPAQNRDALKQSLSRRYNLRGSFVLYTGGDDYRKNIKGAIEGYAAIPQELRNSRQLIIVCAIEDHRKKYYLDIAKKAGLTPDEVIFTGFVPEDELVALYCACDLFVFPSLYEGFGFPVLEAMACGAPVIGGNNSSIRELIARPDAMFDASSPGAIADAMTRVLSNKEMANSLSEYGLQRARHFSWRSAALKALDAFDEALERARKLGVSTAVQGWLPRKRIAVFTPLPPCRSGIADYNAKFLPHLARYFDIDLYVDNYKVTDETLTSFFRVFDAADFDAVAPAYDAILYEFGNSEFHAHMLPLLEKYPGIVGLHDAFLSGLMGYMDFQLGDTGGFYRELLASHGPLARYYLAPVQKKADPVYNSMVSLPCTKRVLNQAIGLISHSPFNLEIARKFYPEGWPAPYRIIPQMVPLSEPWTAEQRREAKLALGFAEDDFIIVTAGHIAWTKWGDRLLEALLSSSLRSISRVHLVFAGELAKDDFGIKLSESVKNAQIGDRIRITGYLSDQDYEHYLRIADLAVQLRTKSRGGTPRAVLDFLAHGVPVLVNNDASYTDYPDEVVIKLPPEPSPQDIAEKLNTLWENKSGLAAYALAGQRYVREHHNPEQCAAQYAAVIHEFIGRNGRTKAMDYVSMLAPHLAGCQNPALAAGAAAVWLDNLPAPSFFRCRLFIDVSHIAELDYQSGIQRVVKEMVRALYCIPRAGLDPVAVELRESQLFLAKKWLEAQGLLLPHELSYQEDGPVCFRAGDILLMLDSSWARYAEFRHVFDNAQRANVPIITAVYDLLPITLPPGNFVDGGREWFEGWFREAVVSSDGFVCISKAVAEEVITYLRKHNLDKPGLKVGYWHLGANFSSNGLKPKASARINAAMSMPYLLMVGTIEPRKSHALALDAMEILWKCGHELGLCIAGKEGWMVETLMKRLRDHPRLNEKLFFFDRPTDEEISMLYQSAAGLLFISKGEGFGLPIVEAAHYGIPIVCSDIPAFREVAGTYATYVSYKCSKRLAEQIQDWWKKVSENGLPNTRDIPRLTWEQSAEALLRVIIDKHWTNIVY